MPTGLPSVGSVYSCQLGLATSSTATLPGCCSCDSLIHHGSQSRFRISQMLGKKRRTFVRCSTAQQLVDSTLNGNDVSWIRSEELTSELQSHLNLVCRLLL